MTEPSDSQDTDGGGAWTNLRAGLSLLRGNAFRRLFLARLASAFGTAMPPIAMVFGVLELTDSPTAVSLPPQ